MDKPILISKSTGTIQPLVSVILPVYNGGEYLKKSLSSVLDQDLKNFELLIIDDCSTDDSFEYLKSIDDKRVRLYKNKENKGLFYNLNFLIKESSTDLVKLWAQDDIMYNQCLGSFVKFHNENKNIGFSYSERDIIDENGEIKNDDWEDNTPAIISKELHAKIAYYTGSIAGNIANVCINKNALNKVGLFREDMKISGDFDMWVRLAEHYETGFVKEKLIMLRDHDKQLSREEKFYINHVKEDLEVFRYMNNYVTANQRKEGEELMRENKLSFYYTLMLKTLLKGNFKTFSEYWKTISSYTNIYILTFYFIKSKAGKKKQLSLT